jgi:hypothetical protein
MQRGKRMPEGLLLKETCLPGRHVADNNNASSPACSAEKWSTRRMPNKKKEKEKKESK